MEQQTMQQCQQLNSAVQNIKEMSVRCGDFLLHWNREAKKRPILNQIKTQWDYYTLAQHTNKYLCVEDPNDRQEIILLSDALVWKWLSCYVKGQVETNCSPLPTLVEIKEKKRSTTEPRISTSAWYSN